MTMPRRQLVDVAVTRWFFGVKSKRTGIIVDAITISAYDGLARLTATYVGTNDSTTDKRRKRTGIIVDDRPQGL